MEYYISLMKQRVSDRHPVPGLPLCIFTGAFYASIYLRKGNAWVLCLCGFFYIRRSKRQEVIEPRDYKQSRRQTSD